MTTFVLVHGAWHGGWCWTRVVERIWARGHRAFAPTLTGLGERRHLLSGEITLFTHIADIVGVLDAEDLRDVVLCGHSYGGCVVAGVIDYVPERIAAAVFLDAFLPHNDESVFDMLPLATRERNIAMIGHAGGMFVPPIAAEHFRVNEADRGMVDARCSLQPAATFLEKIRLTREKQERVTNRTYIRATAYPSETFDRYRRQAEELGWPVHELPVGHDAMLDDPDGLTEILLTHAR